MAKPFDATTKFLVETHSADWVRLLGLPYAEAKLLDTDLSTVTAAADTLLRVQTQPRSKTLGGRPPSNRELRLNGSEI
ncbi:hypothetical protein [Armatimonas sp.]|uniref:hypothetical protein n=1 Tax=Armatimonas sp. TaxID=1872638 RepID=UPI003750B9B9